MQMREKAKGAKAKQAERIDRLYANNFLCLFPARCDAEQVNAKGSTKQQS